MKPLVSLPNSRKFSARVSREELNEKVTNVLNEKGVNHKTQAKIVKGMCQVALESKSPKIAISLPNVREHNSDPWNISFNLIKQFLSAYELQETLDTIELECQDKLHEDKRFENQDVSVFLELLLSQHQTNDQTFQEKIDGTFEEHPLVIDENESFTAKTPKSSPYKKPTQSQPSSFKNSSENTFVTMQTKTKPNADNELAFNDFDDSQITPNQIPVPLSPKQATTSAFSQSIPMDSESDEFQVEDFSDQEEKKPKLLTIQAKVDNLKKSPLNSPSKPNESFELSTPPKQQQQQQQPVSVKKEEPDEEENQDDSAFDSFDINNSLPEGNDINDDNDDNEANEDDKKINTNPTFQANDFEINLDSDLQEEEIPEINKTIQTSPAPKPITTLNDDDFSDPFENSEEEQQAEIIDNQKKSDNPSPKQSDKIDEFDIDFDDENIDDDDNENQNQNNNQADNGDNDDDDIEVDFDEFDD